MPLARLRSQMLVAMGLPACWTQPKPAPPAPSPVVAATPAEEPITPPDADAWATPPSPPSPPLPPAPKPPPPDPFAYREGNPYGCKPDTIVEIQCGRSNDKHGPGCGPTAASLEGYGQSTVEFSAISAPEVARTFLLDPDATAAYQQTGPIDDRDRYCCYARCTSLPVATKAKLPALGARQSYRERCIQQPPGGTKVAAKANAACPAALKLDTPIPYNDGIATPDSPNPYIPPKPGPTCCYAYVHTEPKRRILKGRAARVDGTPRVASIVRGAGWTDSVAPRLDMPLATRARLADAWLRAAQTEHASIASFSALSLRLLALGAPPSLVTRTHEAALDELRHASISFALASAYAGTPLAPAPFPAAGMLAIAGDLADLARETYVDGCINETIAAHEAAVAAAGAEDPVVAGALRTIAEDEARHAELAWAILAWCVRELGPAIVADLRGHVIDEPSADGEDDLASHGVLGGAALARLRAHVIEDVIHPCLDALGNVPRDVSASAV